MQRRNIEWGDISQLSGLECVSNKQTSALSIATYHRWTMGVRVVESLDRPKKMPRLPGRGDTYGDETICYSQAPRKCGFSSKL